MRAVLAAAALTVLLPGAALAGDAPAPGVDWQARVIRVKGSGTPDTAHSMNVAQARIAAERAAKVDAYRNAIEQIKGVTVTSGSAAGQALDDAATRARVESVIHGAKIADTKYFEDGGVDVYLEIPIDGALGDALAPKPQGELKVPATGPAAFTGLVVDATGLKVTPALAPRLVDDKGAEVYGAEAVKQSARSEKGVAAYVKGIDAGKGSPRAGKNPLVVKAVRADKADLVLAPADAGKLRDPKGNVGFLADADVVIVTD